MVIVHLPSANSQKLIFQIINAYYSARFFCLPKRTEPKKKRPEMKNFVHTYARYTGLIGATVWPKFRTISGLPSRRQFESLALKMLIYFKKRFGGIDR
jgi:hypothetical protein